MVFKSQQNSRDLALSTARQAQRSLLKFENCRFGRAGEGERRESALGRWIVFDSRDHTNFTTARTISSPTQAKTNKTA